MVLVNLERMEIKTENMKIIIPKRNVTLEGGFYVRKCNSTTCVNCIGGLNRNKYLNSYESQQYISYAADMEDLVLFVKIF